jgi:hypothetical protein
MKGCFWMLADLPFLIEPDFAEPRSGASLSVGDYTSKCIFRPHSGEAVFQARSGAHDTQ